MKLLKQIECRLSRLSGFKNPRVQLEQYATDSHLAANLVYLAQDDICGKSVVDLGAGCGILTLATSLLEPAYQLSVELDSDAIKTFLDNASLFDYEGEIVQANVLEFKSNFLFDTVIMNPPFGTKNNAGIDVEFLEKALEITDKENGIVYSMHKTSTRSFLSKQVEKWNATMQVVAEMSFTIPKQFKFHRENSVNIMVDLIKIKRKINK